MKTNIHKEFIQKDCSQEFPYGTAFILDF
jgi:hypothetical protein